MDWAVGTKPAGAKITGLSDAVKFSSTISDEIKRENDLVSSRMTWVLTFQGFVFASYALAEKSSGSDLQSVLPYAGLAAVAVSAGIGILTAYVQINTLKRKWLLHEEELSKAVVQPFSGPIGSLIGRLPTLITITAIVVVWLVLSMRSEQSVLRAERLRDPQEAPGGSSDSKASGPRGSDGCVCEDPG